MENKPEDGAPHNPAPTDVVLTPEEIADLKHKAEVSSQNFERAKKAEKEAEDLRGKLQAMPANTPGEFSDEGKVLLGKISALEGILTSSAQKEAMRNVETLYPVLKDKTAEFETFRTDPANQGMPLSTAAKAFLAENDLLVPPKAPRKGVEAPAGGGRTPVDTKMTAEDVADLRNNNYRKYSQLLREGKIKLD